MRRASLLAVTLIALMEPGMTHAIAADLIVSANDGKYQRVEGRDTYLENPPPDTLTLLDAAVSPPRVIATVDVHHTLAGPPQAVAITPDGRLAFVSAPSHYDRAAGQPVFETGLQVIDLTAKPPRISATIDLGAHPQGLAINRAGTLLLAAMVDGSVAVLTIEGTTVSLKSPLKVADKRLAGIAFTHDGAAALVGLRDEGGIVVLDVSGETVSTGRERVSTGVAPYSIDVSGDGKWAVVGNAGLAGLANPGRLAGDTDTFTLIDVSRRPFRAVQHVTVPALPEGIAISPDGRWIAVQAMDGSHLTADNPGRRPRGRVLLFEIEDGQAVKRGDLPGGEAAQGIVFAADSRTLLVQFNVERQIAIYTAGSDGLKDTGQRLAFAAGPASIRTMPR